MKAHQNKSLIRRYYDMWNAWDFARAEELLGEDIKFRGSLGKEIQGRNAFCGYMRHVRRAFPDFHNEIEELVAEQDRVVARLSYTGTHRGTIFGIVPTGKEIVYAGVAFFRIGRGRVAEGWVLGDLLGLVRQLAPESLPAAWRSSGRRRFRSSSLPHVARYKSAWRGRRV